MAVVHDSTKSSQYFSAIFAPQNSEPCCDEGSCSPPEYGITRSASLHLHVHLDSVHSSFNLESRRCVHPLADQAEHSNRPHKEHSIVELMKSAPVTTCLAYFGVARRTAFLDTVRSSSSVLASMNRRRRLGRFGWYVSIVKLSLYSMLTIARAWPHRVIGRCVRGEIVKLRQSIVPRVGVVVTPVEVKVCANVISDIFAIQR